MRRPPSPTAHPRVCGENFQAVWGVLGSWGSPPRVRGKREDKCAASSAAGLTPACAGKTVLIVPVPSPVAAHPRVCGENAISSRPSRPAAGSPPRVRGKLIEVERSTGDIGLTPACAGKTAACSSRPAPSTAHPRVCGENVAGTGALTEDMGLTPACAGKTRPDQVFLELAAAHPRVCGENRARDRDAGASAGSPPRVRGKRHPHDHTVCPVGLTPACAGKTGSFQASIIEVMAHPRVCGENCRMFSCEFVGHGSPPRVRGKLGPGGREVRPLGLTPACAGKTRRRSRRCRTGPAHPRVCGENQDQGVLDLTATGSPPRVRGKLASCPDSLVRRRLTPACAGKTRQAQRQPPPGSAHPRVCGENGRCTSSPPTAGGSPPRVRGKRRRRRQHGPRPRLTPACAGKTFLVIESIRGRSAHPRVCGENADIAGAARIRDGSPPRVRGKPGRAPQRRTAPRLTPACAGKTPPRRPRPRRPRAHPRVCGENASIGATLSFITGSPPRVRGKLEQRDYVGP